MRTKSEEQYLLELRDRLDTIFNVARDHIMDFGPNEELPRIDWLIQNTLTIMGEMDSDDVEEKLAVDQ